MESSVLAGIRPISVYDKDPRAVQNTLIFYSFFSSLLLLLFVELIILFEEELFYYVFLGWMHLPDMAKNFSKFILSTVPF